MSEMYEKAGVSLKEANLLNKKLSTLKNNNLGKFAGAANGFVSCCDGIGSKIIPLYEKKMYKTIAIDVIAANLNDLACSGAEAVGFMDYIAVNKLDNTAIASIIEEIDKELKNYNCGLLGGETSEINSLIKEDKIDICGFAIGRFKHEKSKIEQGDIVIGLASNGIHANGFTLVRQLHSDKKLSDIEFEEMLAPSRIYYNEVFELFKKGCIKDCANITGGGIADNLSRILPDDLRTELDFGKIPSQKVFEKLKTLVGEEFWQVFNGGVGFCIVANRADEAEILRICERFDPFVFGEIK